MVSLLLARTFPAPAAPAGVAAAPPAAQLGVRPVWVAMFAVAAIDALWLAATPIRLSGSSQIEIAKLALLALLGIWGSPRLARFPRLQTLCDGLTFLLVAWPCLRLYNHLTMSAGFPFADEWLAGADAAIGFDWLAYTLWLDSQPALLAAMDFSYEGLTLYSLILFVFLLACRDSARRCRELMVLFFMTAVACSTIGMFVPAEAAYAWLAPPPNLFRNIDPAIGSYHLAHIAALRSGAEPVLDLHNLPGLVTFPSFHTAMGVIAIYCARGIPWLFWPSLTVNALMIASTPLFGSHYLVDVIAGAAIALAAIALLNRRAIAAVLARRRA